MLNCKHLISGQRGAVSTVDQGGLGVQISDSEMPTWKAEEMEVYFQGVGPIRGDVALREGIIKRAKRPEPNWAVVDEEVLTRFAAQE